MQKIFIFGRPGSGKSTVASMVAELAGSNVPVIHLNDYDILFAMYRGELLSGKPENERRFSPSIPESPLGGFNVINPLTSSAWDEAVPCLLELLVQTIDKHAQPLRQRGIVTLEFARRDHREQFRKFSPGFLDNAHFWLVEAPVDTCIERIRRRAEARGDKFIGDTIIQGYYNLDNFPLFADYSIANRKVQRIWNDNITLAELRVRVRRLVAQAFKALPDDHLGGQQNTD